MNVFIHRIKYVVLCFLFLMSADAWASNAHGLVDVRNYSSSTEHYLNKVQNFVQDEDGYVWMGSWNGLVKFDGYNFQKFKSYPADDTRLQSNRIQNVYIAFKNGIWCETYDSQLFLFDTAKEKFFDPFAFCPDIQKYDKIKDIYQLENGITWISDNNGDLWRIKAEGYTKENGIEHFDNLSSKGKCQINGIYSDATGGEWILTNKGYWVYGKKGLSGMRHFVKALRVGNLLLLIDDKGCLVSYSPADGLSEVDLEGLIISIDGGMVALDDHSCLLSSKNGLIKYDSSTGDIRNIPVEGMEPNSFSLIYKTTSKLQQGDLWLISDKETYRINLDKAIVRKMESPGENTNQNVCFAVEDSRGELWIALHNGPLCIYNREKDLLEKAYYYEDETKTPTPDIMLSFMIDSQKNIWGRDETGFNKISFPSGYADFLSYSGHETRSLMLDSQGRVWNGTKNGEIRIYDKNNNFIGFFNPATGIIDKTHAAKFPSNIYELTQDSKGRIWIGTRHDGLYVAVPTISGSYKVRHFTHDWNNAGSINCNSIYSVFEDNKGRIWIGTYGGGLNLVSDNSDEIEFLNSNNGGLRYSFDDAKCQKIRHISSTSDGILMVSTVDGLITFSSDFDNPQDIKFYRNWYDLSRKSTLSSNDVMSTFEDSRHQVYVIVQGGGICRMNGSDLLSDDLSFSYLGKSEGLPTDMVYAMGEDKTGKLWISLENAICSYVPSTGVIESFDTHTFHLPLTLSEAPFVISPEGVAYFPTVNGTLQVDLNKLQKSAFKPNIVFDHAYVSSDNDSIKIVKINDGILNLKSDERNFTISFIAFDYDNTDNISYEYRMDGDDKWINIGRKHETAFYGLPGGDHILEVRSTNGDGVWMDNVASLQINIQPTFSETVWALILTVLGIVAVAVAIWFIVTLIKRLRRQVSVEQELTNLKLRFFTDVSHELRTPLTLIVNPIEEIMSDPSLSKKSREYIEMAKHNSDRMLTLINQLLDIRKIQNNRMVIYVENIDVVPFFRRVFSDFSAIAHQKRIDFALNMNMESFCIYTDIDKLEKIVFNLLSNAFKYTPDEGKVVLEVKKDGGNLLIGVSDTGAGIDKKQLKKIFNRFETLGRRNVSNSSGIGLSLVEELVGILNGKLNVESVPDVGSRFEVKLPGDISALRDNPNAEFLLSDGNEGVATDMSSVDNENVGMKDIEVENNSGSDRPTILIVEDNADLRSLLEKMLSDRYAVLMASDGQEAWEKLELELPDMIISDIMMPRMDGLELLAKVRESSVCSHIPFILLSAKSSIKDRIEGIECGADDYVTKPFSASYLRSRVRTLLSQRIRLRKYFIEAEMSSVQLQEEKDQQQLPILTRFDDKFISELRDLIRENLSNSELTIDEMADAMKMGRTAFNKKVKSLFGLAPVELLKNMRVQLAKELLKESDKTVSEISYLCGFTSPQYFNRVFKSSTDLTPNDWRRQKH